MYFVLLIKRADATPAARRAQAWHYDSDTSEFHTMLLQVAGAADAGYTQFEAGRAYMYI